MNHDRRNRTRDVDCSGALRTDLPSSNTMGAIPEHVVLEEDHAQSVQPRCLLQMRTYRHEVEDSQNYNDRASGHQKTPTRHSQSALMESRFVKISKQRDSKSEHGRSKGNETVADAEKWPGSSKVRREQRELGGDEKH